ncbi:hypothetical protein IFM89_014049 [Coptis chinensis]|uniref:Non-specific lipid-transfer protein n=1 Tax=Coptis chinensis TaxID=261450 RepID=A0A835I4W5_9MAGN|nr:hypothetical protein IFM89_014049 [Coptis chinensis]
MKKVIIGFLVMLVMAQSMLKPIEAFTCMEVTSLLLPCLPYLIGTAPQPAVSCCEGVNRLNSMAANTPERRQACTCIRQAAAQYPQIKDDAVSSLPSKCGVKLPFGISKSTDCGK